MVVTSQDFWHPQYFHDFAYFDVNVTEVRLGVVYSSSTGPFNYHAGILPVIGYIRSRDDHGIIASTTWLNYTWGGGLLLNLGIGYRIGSDLEVEAEWSARRLYTRGSTETYGLRVFNTTGFYRWESGGSDIGIKESSLGVKAIMHL
jgi:hypothetical protein